MKQNLALSVVFTLSAVIVSCANHPRPAANGPCVKGVEDGQCSAHILQTVTTTWSRSLTTTAGTQESGAQSSTALPEQSSSQQKTIQILYKFKSQNQQPVWERAIHVVGGGKTESMIESGVVVDIRSDEISLRQTSSTCDGADESTNTPFQLYYLRQGKNLEISEKPINPPDVMTWNIAMDVVDVFADSVGQAIDESLQASFTFGNARKALESGEGQFALSGAEAATSFGEVGCFAQNGSDFVGSTDASVKTATSF